MSFFELPTAGNPPVGANTRHASGMTCGAIEHGVWGGVDDVPRSVAALRKLLEPAVAFAPGCAVELRITPHSGPSVAYHFRADQPEEIVITAAILGRGQASCSVSLSPIRSDMDRPAKSEDVLHHTWIPIAVRGTSRNWGRQSPTWAAREAVNVLARSIAIGLKNGHGLPAPVVLSGDGTTLLLRADVGRNDGVLIGEFLAAVHCKFSTAKAEVDRSTEAALMCQVPLPYSRVCSGTHSSLARPWMPATIDLDRSPSQPEIVPNSLLRKIAERRFNELKRSEYEVAPWGDATGWRASPSSWAKGGVV